MGIREIRFGTSNLDDAEKFYGGILGLPVRRSPSQLSVQVGWSALSLTQGDVTPGAQHVAFTIPRNQFASAKEWLAARVALLQSDGEDEFECAPAWNARSLYFEGPDHNVLELIVRRDLPNDKDGQFDPTSILGVSEVGVPVADVPAFAVTVREQFGLEPYGQGGSTFRPVGDADGLFIVVENGRAWFPTEHRAVEQTLEVVIDGGSRIEEGLQVAANDSCLIRTI